MSLKVYSVYDAKAGFYSQPMINHSDEAMMRDSLQVAGDPQNKLSRWAEDYTLFRIGDWDETTGIITATTAPVPIAPFTELRRMARYGYDDGQEELEVVQAEEQMDSEDKTREVDN